MTVDLFVIGCGVAGARAAVLGARAGKRVVVSDEGGGMTLLWPGFFDVFGPTAPPPPDQLPTRFARGASERAATHTLDAQRRLDMVAGRNPDHPLATLGFDAERVRRDFELTIETLEIPGTFHREPVLVPTLLGTLRYVDFTCEGMGWLGAGRRRFVGLDEYSQWSPEWAARMAERATGEAHEAVWAATDDVPTPSTLRTAGTWQSPDDARIAHLVRASGSTPSLVPPVLGTTFAVRRAAGELLRGRGADIAEIGGGAESAFGLRLHAHLRAQVDAVTRRVGPVVDLPTRTSSGWRIPLADGAMDAAEIAVELDAVSPPDWAEPWLEPRAGYPRDAGPSPWSVHRAFRRVTEVV